MKSKKILAVICAVSMLTGLTACGNSSEEDSVSDTESVSETEITEEETEESTEETTEETTAEETTAEETTTEETTTEAECDDELYAYYDTLAKEYELDSKSRFISFNPSDFFIGKILAILSITLYFHMKTINFTISTTHMRIPMMLFIRYAHLIWIPRK